MNMQKGGRKEGHRPTSVFELFEQLLPPKNKFHSIFYAAYLSNFALKALAGRRGGTLWAGEEGGTPTESSHGEHANSAQV